MTSRRCSPLRRALLAPLVCLAFLSTSAAAEDAPAEPAAHDLKDVEKALAACMRSPAVAERYPGIEITARLGFDARGRPLGPPRFTYVTPDAPDRIKSEYEHAILQALGRCTPLAFSAKFGRTIAGEPLILRFGQSGLARIRLAGSSAYVAPLPLPSSQIPPSQQVPPLLQPPTRQQPPIWLPGVATPIPNLPHGTETSQDRRARCMFQSQLYAVPLQDFSRYMGLCAQ